MRLALLFIATLALAQSPDLKRNQRVQKLASELLRAQHAYDVELKSWITECQSKGLILRPIAENLMDCVPNPPKPEAKPKPNGETK